MLKVLENLMIQETCIKRLIFFFSRERDRERESFNYYSTFSGPGLLPVYDYGHDSLYQRIPRTRARNTGVLMYVLS